MRLVSTQDKLIHIIEIFRAIAIINVIGYHLNWRFFSFGFLGVDIFFVLSGFLMPLIFFSLNERLRARTFIFRRLKRLLPAYLVVSFFAVISFFLIVTPGDRIRITEQFLSNVFMVSNISNWAENQYFNQSFLRPTLSFWSLGLEIQYYLLFPLIAVLLKQKIRNCVISLIVSFLLYLIVEHFSPTSAFYLLPGRLWEFLAGFVSYTIVKTRIKSFQQPNSRFIGLSFLAVFLLIFLISANFVNYVESIKIFVVFLTALLITLCNSRKFKKSLVRDTFLKIGQMSYSLYLIHLPLAVFFCYHPFSGNRISFNLIEQFTYLIILLSLSFLLHFFIELPAKQFSFKVLTIFLVSSIFFGVYAFNFRFELAKFKSTASEYNLTMYDHDRSTFRCGIAYRLILINRLLKDPLTCKIGKVNSNNIALLIGNSHADSIKTALSENLAKDNIQLRIGAENNALTSQNFSTIIKSIHNSHARIIIYHASPKSTSFELLRKLVIYSRKHGFLTLIVGPIPTYDVSIPFYLFEHSNNQNISLQDYSFYLAKNAYEISMLRSISLDLNVPYIDPGKEMCNPDCLLSTWSNKPFYIDSNHLTLTGSKYLMNKIDFSKNIKSS